MHAVNLQLIIYFGAKLHLLPGSIYGKVDLVSSETPSVRYRSF